MDPEFGLSMICDKGKGCIKWNSDVVSSEVTIMKFSLERTHETNGSSDPGFRLGVGKL